MTNEKPQQTKLPAEIGPYTPGAPLAGRNPAGATMPTTLDAATIPLGATQKYGSGSH